MFAEHATQRAALAWHSFPLQQGKEQIFFFAMVAAVGEEYEEIGQIT